MNEVLKKDIDALHKAIFQNRIFNGIVKRLGRDISEDTSERHDYMVVMMPNNGAIAGGYPVKIYIEEADNEMNRHSLMPLLGSDISFVIIGMNEDEGIVFGSRKKAQQKLKMDFIDSIDADKIYKATIVKFMSFGAFVDISGVSAVLRTVDFSSDHSELQEYYKVGDTIDVKFVEVNDKSKIFVKANVIHKREQPITYDIEPGIAIMGEVRATKTFDKGPVAFVRIDTGLDCICGLPDDFEITKGMKVAVRINTVEEADSDIPPRVRGKIIRVME